MKPQNTHKLNVFVSATVAVLSLAACQKPAQTAAASPNVLPPGALPLDPAPPPGYAVSAPTPSALPPAPPARFTPAARGQRYRYVERAAAMNDAFDRSPPDYAVDYRGTRPWVWRAHNGAYRVAEQVPGGERYYYYDQGAAEPYLVRDPQYTYAYDQGRFVEMYDGYGRPVAPDVAAAQASYAGRYLYYARQLYQAARDNRREAAYAEHWRARQSVEFAEHQQWRDRQQSDAEWRDWHDRNAPQEQAVWRDDRSQRQGYSGGTVAAAAGAAGLAGYLFGSQHHDHNGPADAGGAQQTQAIAQARQQQAQADLVRRQQAAVIASGQQAQTDQTRRQLGQEEAVRAAQIAAQAQRQQAQSDLVRQQQAALIARGQQARADQMGRQTAQQQAAREAHVTAQARQQQGRVDLARQQAVQQQAAQQQVARQAAAAQVRQQQMQAEQGRQLAAQQQAAPQAQAAQARRQQMAEQARQQAAVPDQRAAQQQAVRQALAAQAREQQALHLGQPPAQKTAPKPAAAGPDDAIRRKAMRAAAQARDAAVRPQP